MDKVERILRGLQSAMEARAARAPSRPSPRPLLCQNHHSLSATHLPLSHPTPQDERKAIKGERFLELLVSLGGVQGTLAVVAAKLLNLDPFGNFHWDSTDVAVGRAPGPGPRTPSRLAPLPCQRVSAGPGVCAGARLSRCTVCCFPPCQRRMALILPILVTDALIMLPEWPADPRAPDLRPRSRPQSGGAARRAAVSAAD